MPILKHILAGIMTLGGAWFALMMVVFVMVGAANTKPEDWPMIRGMTWGSATLGVVCFGVAVWMMVLNRPFTATAIGAVPIAVFFGILIVASLWPS